MTKLGLKQQLTIWSLNLMGSIGIAFVGIGVFSIYNKESIKQIDEFAERLSPLITLAATVITALSIYAPMHRRKPDKISTHFTAPTVAICGVLAMLYMIFWNTLLPINIINGFSILGFAGALFRLLKYTEHTK